MKTVYIPKGETVSYESLVTDHLIVDGCLKTAYGVKARIISGNGVICAGSVAADEIRIRDMEAETVICTRLIAKRVEAPEVFASESAVVSCYLSSAYVKTGKLTVSVSEIDEVYAEEVIYLKPKDRSLFGMLLFSALRSFWTRLTAPAAPVMDAEYKQVRPEPEEAAPRESAAEEVGTVTEETPTQAQASSAPADEELNRFINLFKLTREAGFTLRIVPGTPEENAPVFDFEQETIIRPAA